ncbi:hypothetical protein SUGI_0621080 [Cryptomeria japonica]|nr:hypothetical protein SUGI_0621080 [Cryptomeria japonica]
MEPKTFDEAHKSEKWIDAIDEELKQIEKNQTWELVPRLADKNAIGTKWFYRNMIDEEGKIVRHKSRLKCKGYSQVEGIYFEEKFALVARLEAIRMFLSFSAYKGYKIYQMGAKSAFLFGNLEEEVYMEQLEGFHLHDDETFVCWLKKSLYGLKQVPRAWYSWLDKYLKIQGFWKGNVDSNLYIKVNGDHMIIVVVYVDGIIFGGDKDIMCKDFIDQMKTNFEISMLGELSYFLGLEISQQKKGIFISQTKYAKEMLNNFQMEDNKPVSTPMVTSCKLSKNDE